jgi:hypothetical protein
MSDLMKIKQGHHVKGLFHLQRNEPTIALQAFRDAEDFPNAKRQIPFILKELSASPSEIMGSLISALDSGDMQALPWIVKFNDEFNYKHPDIKTFKDDLKFAVKQESQGALLGLMRTAREDGDHKEYISIMIQLINLGNPDAKCEMVNLVMSASSSLSEYGTLCKKQDKLPILNGIKPNFKEISKSKVNQSLESEDIESNFLDSNDYLYLAALLDQNDKSTSSGAHALNYYLNLNLKKYETFEEYVQELLQSQDSRWEDPYFLLVFVCDMRTYLPQHSISVFRSVLQNYGLSGFMDELLNEIPVLNDDGLFDDFGSDQMVRTPAKVAPETAFAYFDKYDSPLFNEFVVSFKDSPVNAERKYLEFISMAMAGNADYFECTAAALEFIDRGYYDFDLVEPMLHGLVMKKLPKLLESSPDISGDFLEYLYRFENGKAYFLDDIRRRIVNHSNVPDSVKNHFYSVS